jgi:hypothetical protein
MRLAKLAALALALGLAASVSPALALDGQPALEPFGWIGVIFDHVAAIFRGVFGGHVGLGTLIGVSPAYAQEAAQASGGPSWLTTIWATVATPLAISGAASALGAALPQAERGTWWGFARKVIDAVAWNWGNAANEPKK